MQPDRFTIKSQEALQAAQRLADERRNPQTTPEHLLARVTCSGHCLMGAYARIRVGHSRKTTTKFSSVYLLNKGGHKTIKIGLDRKTLSGLRSALDHGQKVTATIFGAILDPSGNVEAHTRGKDLRIRH